MMVTKNDLKRYAISTGGFSHYNVSLSGKDFYNALIEMSLQEENLTFLMGKDYKNAEISIKGSISFLLGMVMTKCIAEKIYNIKYLYHLNDPQLIVKKGKRSPDFFGVNSINNEAFLFEAKGTSRRIVPKKSVEGAKDQLSPKYEIEVINYNTYTQFRKHIITTQFKNDRLFTEDIDPIDNKEVTRVEFYNDYSYLHYYKNIYNLLHKNDYKIKTIKQEYFIVTTLHKKNIGLHKSIWDILEKHKKQFKDINKITSEIYKRERHLEIKQIDWESKGIGEEIKKVLNSLDTLLSYDPIPQGVYEQLLELEAEKLKLIEKFYIQEISKSYMISNNDRKKELNRENALENDINYRRDFENMQTLLKKTIEYYNELLPKNSVKKHDDINFELNQFLETALSRKCEEVKKEINEIMEKNKTSEKGYSIGKDGIVLMDLESDL